MGKITEENQLDVELDDNIHCGLGNWQQLSGVFCDKKIIARKYETQNR